MLARDRDGKRAQPHAIGFQIGTLTDAGWRKQQQDGSGSDDPEAAAAAAAEAAAALDGEQLAAAAAAAAAGSSSISGAGLVFNLRTVDAAAARRAANQAPIFSIRDQDDAAGRGKELGQLLANGMKGGKLGVVVKCWGRGAMPVAAKVGGRWEALVGVVGARFVGGRVLGG